MSKDDAGMRKAAIPRPYMGALKDWIRRRPPLKRFQSLTQHADPGLNIDSFREARFKHDLKSA